MKTLIKIIFVSFFSINIQAATLTAAPIKDLMSAIDATTFAYTETGLAFGFMDIKSCVYTSSDMIVVKNYCSPKQNYSAKGYTIISKKFGLVEFYQEDLSNSLLKRDIRLDAFPESTAPYLKANLAGQKLTAINNFLDTMDKLRDPSCWSTNFSFYTNAPDVACYQTDISAYPAWAKETQALLLNQKEWSKLIRKLEKKFPR